MASKGIQALMIALSLKIERQTHSGESKVRNFYEQPVLEERAITYKPALVKQMSGKKTNKKRFCQTAWTYLWIYYYDDHHCYRS